MFLASSPQALHALFVERLKSILSPSELGAFILVLANSIQDDVLRRELKDALRANKQILKESIAAHTLSATQDDLDVFEKLSDIESDRISSWKKHQVGIWQVVSNPFRCLRPQRASSEKINGIYKTFDVEKFNFNKAFLKPEILWEGEYRDGNKHSSQLSVLYNKFPFISYHLLIVPDPKLLLAQFLTQHYHELIWNLVFDTDKNLPGFGVGYNSLGACASVNHLHFQGFIEASLLPIEHAQWSHNGGSLSYPMRCFTVADKTEAWAVIQKMHDDDAPYSILYRPSRCYVIARQPQGSATVKEAVAGAGWVEACGMFVMASDEAVSTTTAAELKAQLKSLSA